MTCRAFIDFLLDYFAGVLPPATLAHFLDHIEECPPCVAYLHSYELTVALCRCAYPDELAPADVPEERIQAILAARGTYYPGTDASCHDTPVSE